MFLNVRCAISSFIDDKSISATIVSDFLFGVGSAVATLVTGTRLSVVGHGVFLPFVRGIVVLTA